MLLHILTMLIAASSETEGLATAEEVLGAARSYLGTPYVYGGASDSGFDCSGFVGRAYADNGYDLPRSSGDLFQIGEPVSHDDLAPGDLVFFTSSPGGGRINHVGLFLGNGEMIHASSGKGEVTYDSLSVVYYRGRYAGARRILGTPPASYARRHSSTTTSDDEEPPLDNLVRAVLADENGLPESTGVASADEVRPRQLAEFRLPSASGRVGPLTLQPQTTAFGVRFGSGRLDDSSGAFAVVEGSYFGHDDALALRLAVPFELPFAGEPRHRQAAGANWNDAHDYSRVLQQARYGESDADLYAELGRTVSGTLGHGSVMRGFSPSLASHMLPDYTLQPDDLSLAVAARNDVVGMIGFVDDVWVPQVGGLSLTLRPAALLSSSDTWWGRSRLSATYAGDRAAPLASSSAATRVVQAAALGLEATPLYTPSVELTTYVEGAGLFANQGSGYGVAAGLLWRGAFGARRQHSWRLRLEGRGAGAHYIPSYFGAPYLIDRQSMPTFDAAAPLTKLELLSALTGDAPMWSGYVDAGYQWQRRFGAGLAYENGTKLRYQGASRPYANRNLVAYVELRRLYFPASVRNLSLYLMYYRRGYESFTPLLSSRGGNEYLFAAANLYLSRYIAVGGSVRRSFATDADGGSVDAIIDIVARYEL